MNNLMHLFIIKKTSFHSLCNQFTSIVKNYLCPFLYVKIQDIQNTFINITDVKKIII